VETTFVDKNIPKNRKTKEANIVKYSLLLLFLLCVNLLSNQLKIIIARTLSNPIIAPINLLLPKKYITAIKKGNPTIRPLKKLTILTFKIDTSL
jgi:hypothetical protein